MTTIERLLTKTRAAADQRSRAAETEYASLVDAAARGHDLDPEVVAEFLEQTRHDVAAFRRDVERLAGRLDARQKLDARPAAERQLAAAEQKLQALQGVHDRKVAKLRAEFDAALARLATEHAAVAQPHIAAQMEAQSAIDSAVEALEYLRATASDELRTEVSGYRDRSAAEEKAAEALGRELVKAEKEFEKNREAIIAAAHYRGECTFREEVQRGKTDGTGDWVADAKRRARANGERFAEEALAAEAAKLQAIRDKIDAHRANAGWWRAETSRVECQSITV